MQYFTIAIATLAASVSAVAIPQETGTLGALSPKILFERFSLQVSANNTAIDGHFVNIVRTGKKSFTTRVEAEQDNSLWFNKDKNTLMTVQYIPNSPLLGAIEVYYATFPKVTLLGQHTQVMNFELEGAATSNEFTVDSNGVMMLLNRADSFVACAQKNQKTQAVEYYSIYRLTATADQAYNADCYPVTLTQTQ